MITDTHLALFVFPALSSGPLTKFRIYRNSGFSNVVRLEETYLCFIHRFLTPVDFKRNLTLIHLKLVENISSNCPQFFKNQNLFSLTQEVIFCQD